MSRALVTTSRYSPGNLSGETLERLSVGRSDLLEEVLKRITASATNKEKHHILLVGPHGIGKTHFVSLLSHRLASRPEYAAARARLCIAHLSEDEWGVATYLDLLIRIIRALAPGSGASQDEADIESIRATFQRSPQAATDLAQKVIRRQVGSGVLLLICENLAELLEALGEEGQRRWRSFIQETMFWTILATTTSLSPGIRLHSSPFYGFFAVKQLERLEPADAIELLRRKALLDGREDLAQFLTTPLGRARVRAIHHLAGGNHRVYVIMSEFLNKESLEDLVVPFMRMVDDLTPYYQDRMHQLAVSQRRIIDTLYREAKPLIVKDIASRCLMSPQTAAKQLGELDSLGFVARTPLGRESYYELAEPLMRLCMEVKDNRTEYLRLFVEVLSQWFTSGELQPRPAAEAEDRGIALRAAVKALSLAQDDIISYLAEAEALVGSNGLNAGLRSYERALSRLVGPHVHSSSTVELLTRVATALLIGELRERGALSLARQSLAIREMFVRQDKLSLLSAALTRMLKHLLRTGQLAAEEWNSALPLLEEAWGSIRECRIPLELLSVAVRYTQTKDASFLLSLPLEQRTLLTGDLEGSVGAGSEDRAFKPVRGAMRARAVRGLNRS